MEFWPSPMVWGYYPELIGWAFQLREIKSTGMHQAPTRGPIFNSVILEVPGEDGIDSVPRSRQCHQGEEAYHTRSKQNLAPDPSHCNFRVHQVTLSSRGHPWQRPVGSIVSTAAHISGPCWPIWQDAFYIKSCGIILPSVSPCPHSPSSVRSASDLSFFRPQALVLIFKDLLYFAIQLVKQLYSPTFSPSDVQFEVANLESWHSECTLLSWRKFTDEHTQK